MRSSLVAPSKPILHRRGIHGHSQPRRGWFFNLVDLVNQLAQEKAAGRSDSLARRVVIAELGYLPFRRLAGSCWFI
jgi:hypothetical protein